MPLPVANIIETLFLTTHLSLNPLSANPTKWSNTLKQFVGQLPTNFLSVFDHFVILALKGLNITAKFHFLNIKTLRTKKIHRKKEITYISPK